MLDAKESTGGNDGSQFGDTVVIKRILNKTTRDGLKCSLRCYEMFQGSYCWASEVGWSLRALRRNCEHEPRERASG